MMPKRPKALVAICTYKRPQQLERCLHSVKRQRGAGFFEYAILVVDNDAAMSATGAYNKSLHDCDMAAWYVCEGRRGIAHARNAAIDHAIAREYDYLVFIDDDETATPEWLGQLMGPEFSHWDILCGPVQAVYPVGTPREFKTHAKIGHGAGNMRIAARVLKGMRFDTSVGLGMGEDSLFTLKAAKAGYTVGKLSTSAKTYEHIHADRATAEGICKRAHAVAAAGIREEYFMHGRAKTLRRRIPSLIFAPLIASLHAGAGVAVRPFSASYARRKWLKARKILATRRGRLDGIKGQFPAYYAQVSGY